MTYTNYAELMLNITNEEFNQILELCPDLTLFDVKDCIAYDTKDDVLSIIIFNRVDPKGEYIDDLEIEGDTLTVWELLDVENKDAWRQKLIDFVKRIELKVEFYDE